MNCSVKLPSFATASPFRPSSCIVPSTATTFPPASSRSSFTLLVTSAGSPGLVVIRLVTVSWVDTPAITVGGEATGVPTVGVAQQRAGSHPPPSHVPRQSPTKKMNLPRFNAVTAPFDQKRLTRALTKLVKLPSLQAR